jgi:hypothetical protein
MVAPAKDSTLDLVESTLRESVVVCPEALKARNKKKKMSVETKMINLPNLKRLLKYCIVVKIKD